MTQYQKQKFTLRGLFDSIFHRPIYKAVNGYFSTFNEYSPHFTTWQGGIYESEIVQSAIEAGAEHASKLKPEIHGRAQSRATRALQTMPNPWMTVPQFLKRVWTILQINDTCIIVPVLGHDMVTTVGYYPLMPQQCRCYDVGGELWLGFHFVSGDETLIEWSRCGVMTRHQYMSDLFGGRGAGNALDSTMELLHTQDEAQINAMKQSAQVRFIGQYGQILNPKDIKKKQKEFNEQNLDVSNSGGLAVVDQSFTKIEQVKPYNYTIDDNQMRSIEKAVYRYFEINEHIVMASFTEEEWDAFYEGRIEPFAVMLGAVLTAMTFTPYEISCGNRIMFSANRLEYASVKTKVQVTTALFDRGLITPNMVADIWQLPHREDGDNYYIRGEYIDMSLISEHTLDDMRQAAQTNGALALAGGADNDKTKDGAEK